MIEIINVPFDLCGPHHGSRLGPLAMHLAGLQSALAELNLESIVSDPFPVVGDTPKDQKTKYAAGIATYTELKHVVSRSLRAGHLPVMIGGDHSASIGSLAGAISEHGEDLAVLWVDAHADLNTPETSPSGNLHGMPLAALCKLPNSRPHSVWEQILGLVPDPKLTGERVAWVGLRDVDDGEVSNMKLIPKCLPITMADIDQERIPGFLARFDEWMAANKVTNLWVSFDLDSLDPVFAPGTGTAVRGGLTFREAHLLAESLATRCFTGAAPYKLAGADIVEVNPLMDKQNETAIIAIEWLQSLLGKEILRGQRGTQT